MALSGSQKAYTQARSGIARSGATRSGYYLFADAKIAIFNPATGLMQDVSPYIRHNGWSVSLNLNDEIDRASIALLPTCPFVPQARSRVTIGLGQSSNTLFAGLVLTVQQTRLAGPDSRAWFDLTCVDWTVLLDAHLVLASYPAQSVTTTILDIVARFTRCGISTAGVASGLPIVEGQDIVNERPSTVLRRLTNAIGGGFYLDANRVLRAWSSAIPSPIQEVAPTPLTESSKTLKSFRLTEDASQQRTRVFVEGSRTTTISVIPPMALGNVMRTAVVDATKMHVYSASETELRHARIGTQLTHIETILDSRPASAANALGTTMSTAAPIGTTTIVVVDASGFPTRGFIRVAEQVLTFFKISDTQLFIEPETPITAPITVGAQVGLLSDFTHFAEDRVLPGEFFPTILKPVPTLAQPVETPVVLVGIRQVDIATAGALANLEGSDGYHEHLVQDGRYGSAGAIGRAGAELASFSLPLVSYEWETEDLNAEPGRMQHIDLALGVRQLITDVRITNVDVTPIATGQPPRRQVRATAIQAAGVLDVWLDDTR